MQQPTLMARQPIYDARLKVVAYELLFRRYGDDQGEIIDGDAATSELLVDAFTQWDIQELVGNNLAFVNFTQNLIGLNIPFDNTRLVVEVLEDVPIDDYLIAELERLSSKGYTIALDDFVYTESAKKILPLADIVKLDVLALNQEEIDEHVRLLTPYKVKLLAEKVETREMYEYCASLGFTMFQGYFLCKPEVMSNSKVPANKLSVLELLQKLQNPDIEMNELEQVVSSDPVLSFKILKLINSAAYSRVSEIESLRQAITMLGIDHLRSLAALMALSGLSDKPSALREFSCVRSKLCGLIGKRSFPADSATYFSVGLLSMLDSYFDKRLEDILSLMTLHEDVVSAIIHREGCYGAVLDAVASYQTAQFNDIDWDLLGKFSVDPGTLTDLHNESVVWFKSLHAS